MKEFCFTFFDGKPQYTTGNKLALLTSLDALIGSINTIKLQNTIHYKYLQNGMRERHHMQERVDKRGWTKHKLFSKKKILLLINFIEIINFQMRKLKHGIYIKKF